MVGTQLQWLKTGLRHPGLAREKITERVRTRWRSNFSYWRRDGSSPPPLTLGFNLTFLCNLRCRMCGQWREGGALREPAGRNVKEMLSLEELERVVDQVSPYRPDVYIWGGEPLMHPRVTEFIRHIKQRGLTCNLNTNGTLLEGAVDCIVESRVDGIDLSVNGPPEVHDAVSGVRGAFERLWRGVLALREAKERSNSRLPLVKAVCTLSETNSHAVEALVKLASEEPVFEALIFNLGWHVSSEVGAENDRLFKKVFGCESTAWKGFVDACGKPDIPALQRLYRLTNRGRHPILVQYFPSVREGQLGSYYEHPDLPLGKSRCISPWIAADVRPNGDVTFCPDYPDYIIGNIKEESFPDIWNGERARHFRNTLRKHRLFPICSRCCGLYLYY